MKTRCLNPNSKDYKHYGQRGITICPEWYEFLNFFSDIGASPSPYLTLDRLDNEKGYYKENCEWRDITTQRLNRRAFTTKRGLLTGARKTTHGDKFHSEITINKKRYYLGTFNTEQEAHERYLQERTKRQGTKGIGISEEASKEA